MFGINTVFFYYTIRANNLIFLYTLLNIKKKNFFFWVTPLWWETVGVLKKYMDVTLPQWEMANLKKKTNVYRKTILLYIDVMQHLGIIYFEDFSSTSGKISKHLQD